VKSFAAIDFETANFYRSSICSMGIVIVENGIITEKFYELVKPAPNYYNRINIEIHGLNKKDTDNALNFPEVWSKIYPKISHLPFFAHNSPFDEGCLKAVYSIYEMQYPDIQFHCSCRLSRKHLKGLPNHKLNTVSNFLGFNLENHHHALADAEACAWIALNLI
jgi:DNA polymerase-3 subunit epsilon